MSTHRFVPARLTYAAWLACVGVLLALPVQGAAQTEQGSSSSRDNLLSASDDMGGSAAALPGQDRSDRSGGYSSHNRFSLDHFQFEGGGGFTIPTGSQRQFENTGWNIRAGGGYKFNSKFAAMLDYDYVSMGIPSAILNQVNPQGGGATHLWSLTLNPMFNYATIGRWGGYVTGGGGFFRKVVNFTQPFEDSCAYYDPYYGCIPGVTSQTVAHFSNNAGGLDFGTGFTRKMSDSGRMSLFGEARYVWVDNQASTNNTASTGYTPANDRTEFIPITFGIRF